MMLTRQQLPPLGEGEEYTPRPYIGLVYNVEDPTEAVIVVWRSDCFERLGFIPLTATALATRRDVDREDVARMIGAGATPAQVADILL